MLLTNSCTWLEEPYNRRCDVRSGISHNGTCFNLCSEGEKINCFKYPYRIFSL